MLEHRGLYPLCLGSGIPERCNYSHRRLFRRHRMQAYSVRIPTPKYPFIDATVLMQFL